MDWVGYRTIVMNPQVRIPTFKLYGEAQFWSQADSLHCETIERRSRLHAWHIDTHRHVDLTQLLYVRRGEACIHLEGEVVTVAGPVLQVLPALCVHAFDFVPDIDGVIITLAMVQVERLQRRCAHLDRGLFRTAERLMPLGDEAATLDALISELAHEYGGRAVGRDVLLDTALDRLAVWLIRQRVRHERPAPQRHAERHLSRFLALVEAHYAEHWPMARYAAALGITVAHLNALCREWAACTALAVVHQRLLLEAKRTLRYTSSTVAQVADLLGFADPAYFARFFRRRAGMSPGAYRRAGAEL